MYVSLNLYELICSYSENNNAPIERLQVFSVKNQIKKVSYNMERSSMMGGGL